MVVRAKVVSECGLEQVNVSGDGVGVGRDRVWVSWVRLVPRGWEDGSFVWASVQDAVAMFFPKLVSQG